MKSQIITGDCLTVLPTMPEKCFQTCVTSPPYWGLRSYEGVGKTYWPLVNYSVLGFPVCVEPMACALGHEKEVLQFVGHLVLILREVRRVLKDDGTVWINMGDSHAGSWGNYGGKNRGAGSQRIIRNGSQVHNKAHNGTDTWRPPTSGKMSGDLKRKDLAMVPATLALALRNDGWYLRSDIIFSKKNCMPESVTDRPTRSHEYIFLLAKSAKYYYDAKSIRTAAKYPGVKKYAWGRSIDGSIGDVRKGKGEELRIAVATEQKKDKQRGHSRRDAGFNDRWDGMTKKEQMALGANRRTVWEVATQPFPDSHFATFPEKLITDPILAGSREGDFVLDPFFGAGTTGIVAHKHHRNFVGVEASSKYVEMATNRIRKEFKLFSPL